MLVDEIPIGEEFKKILKSEGINELYPTQESLVKSRILETNRSLVLSTPTASGKTIAAEIAMMNALEKGKRAVYIVPLRALAYEKFREFQHYESLGYKVRIEMGDLDSKKYKKFFDFDILVATAEKCDSILRSRPEWFENVGILVMDEIHLLGTERGPVYEIIISKFQKLFKEIQILALSATIGNTDELADWLNAELIESEWRPVPLEERVVIGQDKYEKIKEIVKKSLFDNGQILVFVNSRRSAESVAENIGEDLKLISKDRINEAVELSKEILSGISSPTKQCKRLANCVINGTAFHHAGITNKQRILIEDAFKKGILKVIVATPTLAAGVNLPSRIVIIRDLQRYGSSGYAHIPVLEYKQQIGRAGRPKYDKFGEAITIAKNESDKEFLIERYVNGRIENIHSRLGIEPVLRFHVLAAIASGFTRSEKSVRKFFQSTFFGYQYGIHGFEDMLNKIIINLEDWYFIRSENGFLIPTPIGKRISELYIDPQTAHNYISILQRAERENRFPTLGLLEMLCDSIEISSLPVKRKEEPDLWTLSYKNSDKLFRNLEGFDLDFNFLERFKTAKLFELWIEEVSEDKILELYNIPPGILYSKIQNLEWLAYSASEISRIQGWRNSTRELMSLELRIKYGIKEELIPLIGIKGIGRARARKLFNSGYKTINDLKEANSERLRKLLGRKVAEKIIREIR